jgi:hypothetical protein
VSGDVLLVLLRIRNATGQANGIDQTYEASYRCHDWFHGVTYKQRRSMRFHRSSRAFRSGNLLAGPTASWNQRNIVSKRNDGTRHYIRVPVFGGGVTGQLKLSGPRSGALNLLHPVWCPEEATIFTP